MKRTYPKNARKGVFGVYKKNLLEETKQHLEHTEKNMEKIKRMLETKNVLERYGLEKQQRARHHRRM